MGIDNWFPWAHKDGPDKPKNRENPEDKDDLRSSFESYNIVDNAARESGQIPEPESNLIEMQPRETRPANENEKNETQKAA